MARPPSPPSRRASGANQSYAPLWLSITFVLVVTVSLPSVVMLFFAMLPSVVAFIVDRTPQKYATYCVTGLNFSGVFPYLLDLWAGDHTVGAAIALVTNVFALLTMYGAAAVGWAIFAAVPPVVGAVLTVLAERRVAELRALQKTLIEEWGEDVGAPSEQTLLATPGR